MADEKLKKFWEYMDKKYGCHYDEDFEVWRIEYRNIVTTYNPLFHKQMLMGYKIEFLNKHNHLFSSELEFAKVIKKNVNVIDNYLNKRIKELE